MIVPLFLFWEASCSPFFGNTLLAIFQAMQTDLGNELPPFVFWAPVRPNYSSHCEGICLLKAARKDWAMQWVYDRQWDMLWICIARGLSLPGKFLVMRWHSFRIVGHTVLLSGKVLLHILVKRWTDWKGYFDQSLRLFFHKNRSFWNQ